MSKDPSPDCGRALALLAGRDRRADVLTYVTRAAQRACGAVVAVLLLAIPSAHGTPTVARVLGRSAGRVARKLAELGSADFGTQVRLIDAAGYRVLITPVSAPAGAAGALAVGIRAPRRFSTLQRRHVRALADLAAVAFQLAALQQSGNPPAVMGHGQRPLSRREREVVMLLLGGASAKEAAARLGISQRTVETYLQRLKVRERQPRLHALLGQLVRQGRV